MREIARLDRVALPELVIVTLCCALLTPRGWLLNTSDGVERVTPATPTPTPDRPMERSLLLAITVSEPE